MSTSIDRAKGFRPFGFIYTANEYVKTTDEIITEGDLVKLTTSGIRLAGPTDTILAGVAAETKAAADTTIKVYDNPNQEFVGQCSGTMTQAILGTHVDMEGLTGVQEINENATDCEPIMPVRLVPGEVLGANSECIIKITSHIFATDQAAHA